MMAPIEPDDATNGKEMISPPMEESNIGSVRRMTWLFQSLGARAKLPCAFHVHAGVRNTFDGKIRLELVKQVVLNFLAIEHDLDFMQSSLVHDYHDMGDLVHNITFSDDMAGVIEYANQNGRQRSKINLQNLSARMSYGTMEFRQHPGTVCPVETQAWVKFVDSLISQSLDMVREKGWAQYPDTRDVDHLKSLVKTFVKDRRQPSTPGFRSQDHNEMRP